MRFSTVFVAASTIALGACAGRAPQPVAIVQAQDQFSDCAAISAEVQANNNRISELASEKGAQGRAKRCRRGRRAIYTSALVWNGLAGYSRDGRGCAAKSPAISRYLSGATLCPSRAANGSSPLGLPHFSAGPPSLDGDFSRKVGL
jgi:hypothetical protein